MLILIKDHVNKKSVFIRVQGSAKGNQPWIFFGRTNAVVPILWPPDAKSQLTGKDPDVRKDWGQEEKGMTEDEMVGWHHWLNRHEFEQTLGGGEGQRSLAAAIHGVTKNQIQISSWRTTRVLLSHTFTFFQCTVRSNNNLTLVTVGVINSAHPPDLSPWAVSCTSCFNNHRRQSPPFHTIWSCK